MIAVVGEALVDLVISPDGSVTAALGGAPFNTARTCGRLGVDVAFVGALSLDRFGTLLADRLAEDGVDLGRAPRVEAPTTLAAAEIDERGTATYRFYVADTSAPALSAIPDGPGGGLGGDVVFTGGLGLVLEPMATTIEAALVDGAGSADLVMVDINCRPLVVPDRDRYVARVARVVESADVVKVSDEDLAYLFPGVDHLEAARRLLAGGPTVVLLTAGGGGVTVLTRNAEVVVPVDPVSVVDTIGAGDAFGGGFVSWWTASGRGSDRLGSLDDVVAAVRAANAVAGVVVTRRGADPPWRRELPADWSG